MFGNMPREVSAPHSKLTTRVDTIHYLVLILSQIRQVSA
jgi:hypothetical protein